MRIRLGLELGVESGELVLQLLHLLPALVALPLGRQRLLPPTLTQALHRRLNQSVRRLQKVPGSVHQGFGSGSALDPHF